MAFGANAQTFPTPYCEIDQYLNVEEITSVDFNGTVIENSDLESILLNFTSTIVDVAQDQSYTIAVKGNTYGEYDNEYVAFVDWNHNNVLDDEGEVYYIGLIFDSTGEDSITASTDIVVPEDALPGNTRIRVVKVYTDVLLGFSLIMDPCNILNEMGEWGTDPSYGQALDFTLNVATLGAGSLNKKLLSTYPNPVKDFLNVKYVSEITEVKIYNMLGQEVLAKNIGQSDFKIDVSGFSAGTYIVKLTASEGQHTFKLIKE